MSTEQAFNQPEGGEHPADLRGAQLLEKSDLYAPNPVYGVGHVGHANAGAQVRITRFMLFAAVFLCGWSVLRIGDINLTLSDIGVTLVVCVMLVRGELNTRPFGQMTVFWISGLTLMLAGLLLSTIANGVMVRWLIVAAQYLFAFLLVPMVLMGQQTTVTKRLPTVFVLGIVVSQMIGISAILLFEPADTLALMGDGFLTGNGRVGAMTGEPNPNGAMVAFAFPMLLYCIRNRMIPTGLGLLCGAILAWGLLLSGSFTGFAASVVATGVYLAFSGFNQFAKVAMAGVVGIFLFVASGAPLPEAFENRVAGALTTGDLNEAGTFSDRADLISEAWQMADDNVLVGLGVDQYRVVSPHGAPVHELHLLIWNEGGALGFVGLLMLLLMLIAGAVSALSKSRPEGAMILAVVAVFMVYTFSIPHMYSRQWIMPVLLAMSTFFAIHPNFDAFNKPWQRS
ncbi:MAG: O-antigen ligase family protein [Pseudomonadota bacterium]